VNGERKGADDPVVERVVGERPVDGDIAALGMSAVMIDALREDGAACVSSCSGSCGIASTRRRGNMTEGVVRPQRSIDRVRVKQG